MSNFNFQFNSFFLSLKIDLERKGSSCSVIFIVLYPEGTVLYCCIIFATVSF